MSKLAEKISRWRYRGINYLRRKYNALKFLKSKVRVYDTFIFNGETEALSIRLQELSGVVDFFVLAEGDRTYSGEEKNYTYIDAWDILKPFADRLRIVHVSDWPVTTDPWERERHQRNAVLRGCRDAHANDWIMVSDVDEIPRRTTVETLRKMQRARHVGFKLSFRYFALNYVNSDGPESNLAWNYAARKNSIVRYSADKLRYVVRAKKVPSTHIEKAGWHFSYLGDRNSVIRKIRSFSHQEWNRPDFLAAIDIPKVIRGRQDFFGRKDFSWDLADDNDYPIAVLEDPDAFRHLFAKTDGHMITADSNASAPASSEKRSSRRAAEPRLDETMPMVICAFLHDNDRAAVEAAFDLKNPANSDIPIHFWQDKARIGPERAFETCWSAFPDRDIVILHPDMAPVPGQDAWGWYRGISDYRKKLPDAGMIACNLLFPQKDESDRYIVQCAGGTFEKGKIRHISNIPYPSGLDHVREVPWVTFGGVLIRRRTIDCCGGFDRRYEWAYVMDVDYCLEARLRGFRLYQVPETLLHEENGTTKEFLKNKEYEKKLRINHLSFYRKWHSTNEFHELSVIPRDSDIDLSGNSN